MSPASLSIPRCAVIGHPVAHSRSPAIHQAFAASLGHGLLYERMLAPLDGFVLTATGLAQQGYRGLSVTVPFKFEAAALAGQMTERVRLAGAANTLRFEHPSDRSQWLADNTDGVGLVRDIEHNAATPLAGTRVLLVGAGGASAGALGPLLHARPAMVVVVNRSADKAQALVERHADLARRLGVALLEAPLQQPGSGFDVLINGTSSSLQGHASPVPSLALRPGCLAIDMMYGPAAAPFLAWAARHKAVVRDGLGMLVEQAAEQYALWHGVRPATAAVLARVREEVSARTIVTPSPTPTA